MSSRRHSNKELREKHSKQMEQLVQMPQHIASNMDGKWKQNPRTEEHKIQQKFVDTVKGFHLWWSLGLFTMFWISHLVKFYMKAVLYSVECK